MKIVCSGDWHLDAVTAGVERFDEVAAAVATVVEAAVQPDVDLFAFLGDLCNPESPRAWRAVRFGQWVVQQLELVHSNRTRVQSLWLVGNHDVVEDGCGSSTLLPLTAFIEEVIDGPMKFDIAGVDVVGLPCTSRVAPYDPGEFVRANCGKRPLVVLSHLSLHAAQPGSESADMARGREVFLPARELQLLGVPVTVLNGHYHKRQTVLEDGLEVQCVGSLARLTRGERDNSPAFLVVEV
jgi:hypothetical protein